ncbi:hypothetical protein [Terricaulis sp.]|uniref:hypothetical protein n=1 Tax=Terricaulis sp. TaxID=2768686 RepID=UPI002AC5DC3A|nr:hypothetical protein [Terricaulis sp.]MDZ4689847.1 hypothetical protein [Terricaulis sp.]
MLRIWILAAAFAASACAPAPVTMPATQASEVLELFAAGRAPGDVCTAQGRAMLRGAVRAYGAAMAEAGEVWPDASAFGDAPDSLSSVEVSVMIGVAAGFVEVSDLHGPARGLARQMTFAHWPSMRDLRRAADVACPELVELQQTAARFVVERERYESAMRRDDARASERRRRHAERMQRSLAEMQMLAEVVTRKVEESRAS